MLKLDIHRKTSVMGSLFNKVTSMKACNFIKREFSKGIFLWVLRNVLRTTFFKEHFWWLLQYFKSDLWKFNISKCRRWSLKMLQREWIRDPFILHLTKIYVEMQLRDITEALKYFYFHKFRNIRKYCLEGFQKEEMLQSGKTYRYLLIQFQLKKHLL